MKYYLLVFSLLFSALSYSQQIPILGFIGVPGSNATSENYSKMEKAGFTISLMNFKNTNEALNALAAAKKTKIKLIFT